MPNRKRITGEIRLNLLKAWDYHCAGCQQPIPHCCLIDDGSNSVNEYLFDIDHLHGIGSGGEDELYNLQVLCFICHRIKSRREQLTKCSQCIRCKEVITRENHSARSPHACVTMNHRGDPVHVLQSDSGPWFNQPVRDLRIQMKVPTAVNPHVSPRKTKKITTWKQLALFKG